MDPLFGFVDDISEQQQHQPTAPGIGGGGEYTISFPTLTTPIPGFQQGQSSQLNMPTNPSSAMSQQPVVRIVTGKSEDNQQIYVIKMENLTQINNDLGGTQAQSCNPPPPTVNTQKASANQNLGSDEENANSESKGDDDGPDPFMVVSPESVMAYAQSVGVELNEDDASELGCLTTNKLRHVLLLALQFSQNENAEGIRVQDFAKAEKQVGFKSFGHDSAFRETGFKYVGNMCVQDDGPELDVYATIKTDPNKPREIPIDYEDPILHVHHLRTHNENSQLNTDSNFNLYTEPVTTLISGNGNSEDVNSEQNQNDSDPSITKEAKKDLSNNVGDDTTAEHKVDDNGNISFDSGSPASNEDCSGLEDEEIADAMLTELKTKDQRPAEARNVNNNTEDKSKSNDSAADKIDDVAPEWSSYLQVLFEETLSHCYEEEDEHKQSAFEMILSDIRRNGAHPVFHIICDAIRDYLRNSDIRLSNVVNMLAVADTLVSSQCKPTLLQMTDLGSMLVEIIILPPPCNVHSMLTSIFIKVLESCNELLTWTCTYVTEMLKGICETPMDNFQDALKCAMHGALCLANGLEELHIQVAQEFGWHTSVLAFSKNYASVYDGQSYCLTQQDAFLEQEVLKFFHNFLNNYTGLVQQSELCSIRDAVTAMFGERFTSCAAPFPPPSTNSSNCSSDEATKLQYQKTHCSPKKLNYSEIEAVVPSRSIFNSLNSKAE